MGKKRLLLLHNGTKRETSSWVSRQFAEAGLEVDSYWAFNNEFPETLESYDGVYISGSPHAAYEDVPFIQREHELIADAAEQDLPMLGVCFGSQIMASALCGREQVFRRESCEVGYKWIDFTEAGKEDPLTAHLDPSVYMFIWHNDEVRDDHPDMTILASSDACPNQIWRYRERPFWGIQGHPEITKANAEFWFDNDGAAFEQDGADLDELRATANDTLEAKTLLRRFAELCKESD